jgi:hypothetical protein
MNTAATGHWATFHVVNADGHDVIGAALTATVGERTIHRRVRTDGSYLSASSPLIHLGLGEADRIDSLTVTWPDGKTSTHGPFEANRHHEVRRKEK